MPGRVVEAVYVANIDDLKLKMAQAAAVSDKAGQALGDSFAKGSEKAGIAIKGLSAKLGELDIAGAASLGKFGNSISMVETKTKSLGAALASVGKMALVGGLVAFAAAAYEGVKGAMALQQQMEMIHTQAGAAQSEVTKMTSAVLGMAASVGTSPQTLATGLYHIESAGYRGATALNMLKVAAEGAKVGNADLTDTAQALAATIYSNIPGAQNLQQAMGALNATVGAGDMTMQQLNEAFQGPMLATVKGYGLSIKDVGAALADFGDLNIRGADAATQLRMAVQYMAKPAATAGPMLAALGLNTRSFAQAMANGGLLPALDLLKQKLIAANVPASQYAQVISDIFTKKGSAGVEILINSLGRLQSKYKDITVGEGSFNADWTATTKNLSFMWSQVEAGAAAFADKLGGYLIPKLISLGQYVARNKGAFEDLAKVLAVTLGASVTWFVGTKAVEFVQGIQKMIVAAEGLALKWSATSAAMVSEDGTIVAANDAAAVSFGTMATAIGVASKALGVLLAGFVAYEGTMKLLNTLHPTVKPTAQLSSGLDQLMQKAGINPAVGTAELTPATIKYLEAKYKVTIAGGQLVSTAAPKVGTASNAAASSPSTAQSTTPNSAVSSALAGPATTVSTAMTAAQLATDIAGVQANEQLKLASSKAAGGSMEKLTSLLTGVHQAGFNRLITALTNSDNVSLQKMGATLQTTFQTALTKLYQLPALATYAKANAIESGAQRVAGQTTASGNVGTAATSMVGLKEASAADALNAAATAINDAAKLQSDAAAALVAGIQAQTTAITDQANAQVAAINDQTQTQVDTLGERGLYGLALQAQLAKVALDQQKATDDQQIAAAQAHLDQVTAATNADVAAAQLRVDAVQQQSDAAIAAAQTKLDSDAIANAIHVAQAQAEADQAAITAAVNNAAAQAHVDAVQFGSQAQQTAAAAAQKLVSAQSDSLTATANSILQGVTNAANLSNANDQAASTQATAYWSKQLALANAMLTTSQNNATVQQAQAQQSLTAITSSSAITEAKLTAIYNVDNELVSTQFAGGYVVNVFAQPGDGPLQYANAVSWAIRTSPS